MSSREGLLKVNNFYYLSISRVAVQYEYIKWEEW